MFVSFFFILLMIYHLGGLVALDEKLQDAMYTLYNKNQAPEIF
jgi:hypothetical protein